MLDFDDDESEAQVGALKAPMPFFGGKAPVAPLVWARLGNVGNYCEPFVGSAAMLLARPHEPKVETVNDINGFIANLWRALQAAPDEVAHYVDRPVFENDLHAIHYWLTTQGKEQVQCLEGDPDFFDAKIAGWWVWGMSVFIGSGFCSGDGPWQSVDGKLVKDSRQDGDGVRRKIPHLGDAGMGVNRSLPRIFRPEGIKRKSVTENEGIYAYFNALAARFRNVRVCCGDWERICGLSPTTKLGLTGVFLDPPYADENRDTVYEMDDFNVAKRVEQWCRERGDDPLIRIALCGYEGNYDLPGWEVVPWKAQGGYSNLGNSRGKENRHREVILFSPHCLKPDAQIPLF